MKTYFLMIGAAVILTLIVCCIIYYRMSLPDSISKPQITQTVQKQIADNGTRTKKTDYEASKSTFTEKKSVTTVTPAAISRIAANELINTNQITPQNVKSKMTKMWQQTNTRESDAGLAEKNMEQHNKYETAATFNMADRQDVNRRYDSEILKQYQEGAGFVPKGRAAFQKGVIGIPLKSFQQSDRKQNVSMINEGLSSRIPEEILNAPPFQPRIQTNNTKKPLLDSPQTTMTQQLFDNIPPQYKNKFTIIDDKIVPNYTNTETTTSQRNTNVVPVK